MRNWPRASFLRPFSGFFQQLLTTSFSAAFCGHEKRKENWHGTWTNDVFNTTSCAPSARFSSPFQPYFPQKKSVKKGNTKVLCSKSTFPTINLSEDSKQNFHLVTQKSLMLSEARRGRDIAWNSVKPNAKNLCIYSGKTHRSRPGLVC